MTKTEEQEQQEKNPLGLEAETPTNSKSWEERIQEERKPKKTKIEEQEQPELRAGTSTNSESCNESQNLPKITPQQLADLTFLTTLSLAIGDRSFLEYLQNRDNSTRGNSTSTEHRPPEACLML